MRFCLFCGLALWVGPLAFGQEAAIPHAQDKAPGPALSPDEAIAAMTVAPGFRVEVVASEPMIVNPVSMTFDEKGRIWITESLEYPRRESGLGRDRVKVLEDTDGDGKADKATVFCEGLNIPSGIAIGHGGVWVANSPDILFYPDMNHDAIADGPPQTVATGFGRDDTHELPNSLTWGPDGWLYGWNGVFNQSKVRSSNGTTYEFTCAIWRIHPITKEFQIWCEGTSNPWGIAINDDGELFASACVIDHLWHLVESAYYIRQGGPYPEHTWPMGSIVDHQHQKAAYCGIHWFDSDAYPEEYRKRLYMGNIHGNCINVDTLERNGASYIAKPGADFLTANDAWFMPVAQKTGPDGSLYILDWYDRYHCYQDANRDPEGIDRLKGRLYRVRYGETPRVKIDLGSETNEQLFERLGASNDFIRATARRILVERAWEREFAADARVREAGHGMLRPLYGPILDGETPRTKAIESLWTVVSGPVLSEAEDIEFHQALKRRHADPVFRAWGYRWERTHWGGRNRFGGMADLLADRMAEELLKVSRDAERSDPVVHRELTISAGYWHGGSTIRQFVSTLVAAPDDRLVAHLVWQNLQPLLSDPEQVDALIAELDGDGGSTSKVVGALGPLWPRIVERLAAAETIDGARIAAIVNRLLRKRSAPDSPRPVLDAVTRQIRERRIAGERLERIREALGSEIGERIRDLQDPIGIDCVELAAAWGDSDALAGLARTLADSKSHPAARSEALDILVFRRSEGVLDATEVVLSDPETPGELRGRVLDSLGPLESPRVAEVILRVYPKLAADRRARAIVLLTERESWARQLLGAIERKEIEASVVNLNQVRRLRQLIKDPALAKFVLDTWGTIREGRNEQRELVVGQMRNHLAKTPGDPIAGTRVYERVCAQCHKLYGQGQDVGPDITLNGRNDFGQLLTNVFDPNLVIGVGYQSVTVATKDGRILTGLVAEEGADRVVLKLQGGVRESINRLDIDEMKLNTISLMPEELEKQLTPQEIADLFAFLVLDRPPSDPNAKRLPGAPAPSR